MEIQDRWISLDVMHIDECQFEIVDTIEDIENPIEWKCYFSKSSNMFWVYQKETVDENARCDNTSKKESRYIPLNIH